MQSDKLIRLELVLPERIADKIGDEVDIINADRGPGEELLTWPQWIRQAILEKLATLKRRRRPGRGSLGLEPD